MAICIGVTAIPCPIGMFPSEDPEYSSGLSTMPPASAGRPTSVGEPKPNPRTHLSKRMSPSFRPIITVPTFDERARMSATDRFPFPPSCASPTTRSATWISDGTSRRVSGLMMPSSSAPAIVKGLKVEPGS